MRKGDTIKFDNKICGKITAIFKTKIRVYFEDMSFMYDGKIDGSGSATYLINLIEKGISEGKVEIIGSVKIGKFCKNCNKRMKLMRISSDNLNWKDAWVCKTNNIDCNIEETN